MSAVGFTTLTGSDQETWLCLVSGISLLRRDFGADMAKMTDTSVVRAMLEDYRRSVQSQIDRD